MKIKGRDRWLAKLERMPKEVKSEAREALADGGEEMVGLAKQFVPTQTGKLRDSIIWRYGNEEKTAYSQGLGGSHELSVVISAGNKGVRYAHLVEFDTAPRPNGGMFEGTTHPGTAASPFFYPSFRILRRRMRSRVTRKINKAIKKVAAQ